MNSKDIILEINEVKDYCDTNPYTKYDGFEIKTSQQTVKLLVENVQSCCEDFNTIISPKVSFYSFVGSEIINVKYSNKKDFEEFPSMIRNDSDTQYVTIEIMTSNGPFYLIGYNHHNGYYSHECIVEWKDFKETGSL